MLKGVCLVGLCVLFAPALGAQEPPDEEESNLNAGWDGENAYITSSNGEFLITFGGRLHTDFRAYTADFAPSNTFLIRRARFEAEGHFFNIFEYKIQADFADDESTLLRDGFVNIHTNDIVQVMVGQFKAPLSQEEQQSSKYYGFVERSMLNNLAPGRSPGVMVHGHTENNVFRYGVSFQNDEGELGLNRNGTPDLFAGARFEPWTDGLLDTLSFGGGIGYGHRDEERFVIGRTSSRSIVFFDKVPLDGRLIRRNLEGWWYPGRVLIEAEYDDIRGERRGLGEDGADLPTIRAGGFMVAGNYVLTGETNEPEEPITPRRPLHEGGPGAWEIGFRYQYFDIEAANRSIEYTVGVNWWMNAFVRLSINASWERFKNPLPSGETSSIAFLTRLGLYF